jgi:hypothetical protein
LGALLAEETLLLSEADSELSVWLLTADADSLLTDSLLAVLLLLLLLLLLMMMICPL